MWLLTSATSDKLSVMVEVNCSRVPQGNTMLHISFSNDLSIFNNRIRASNEGAFGRPRVDVTESMKVKALALFMISEPLIWHLTVRHLDDTKDQAWILFNWKWDRVESMHFVVELKVKGEHFWGLWFEHFSFLVYGWQILLDEGHHDGLFVRKEHHALRVTNVIDYSGRILERWYI